MIPSELKQKAASPEPLTREHAAKELREYPELEALRLLVRMLSDDQDEVVYAATRSLIARGKPEVMEELLPLLTSHKARLRNLAIEIMSKIGTVLLDRIMEMLDDRNKDIRKFAVDILKLMNVPETEDALIKALFDDNPNVAGDAAEALGLIGTQRSVPHLISSLSRDPWLKCAALKSLGAIGGEEALTAILATRPEETEVVLFCAVTALGNLGDIRGLPFLTNLLDRENPILQSSVLPAIESVLKKAGDATIEQVRDKLPIPKILNLLDDENMEVVRSAISLLGLMREKNAIESLAQLYTESNRRLFDDLEEAFIRIRPDRVEPILKILHNDRESESVKIAAIRIVARVGGKNAFHALEACLHACGDALKSEVILAMGALQDRRAIPMLHECLQNNSHAIRDVTIEILQSFHDDSSISALMALSTHTSEATRMKAAKSLRHYALNTHIGHIQRLLTSTEPGSLTFGLEMIPESLLPNFTDDLLRLGRHPDQRVRKIAIERAGSLNNKQSFHAVTASLSAKETEVRLAAIRSLEALASCDVGPVLLEAIRHDPVEWNCYEAVQIIGRLKLIGVLPELIALLDTAPDLVKTAILDVLGTLGSQNHRKILEEYARSSHNLLQEAAHDALEELNARFPG